MTLWSKQVFAEGQFAAVKAHMILEATVAEVVCIITDLEHRPKWNKQVDVSTVVAHDENRDIAYIVVSPPLSLVARREQVIGRRFSKKNNQFTCIVKSMPHTDYPEGKDGMVRTDILISVTHVTQIDEKRVLVEAINQTNINGWIPWWISATLQGFVTKQLMGSMPDGFKYYRENGLVDKINKKFDQ
jgi:hypothetical protein